MRISAIVVNSDGDKIEFVILQEYELGNGESFITEDIVGALEKVKPRWNGTKWLETATPEELQAHQDAQALP